MSNIKDIQSITTKPTYISKLRIKTDPVKLVASIQLSLMSGNNVEVMAMGKDACYITNKAICITQCFAENNGLALKWKPCFKTAIGIAAGQPRSVMSWFVWEEGNPTGTA